MKVFYLLLYTIALRTLLLSPIHLDIVLNRPGTTSEYIDHLISQWVKAKGFYLLLYTIALKTLLLSPIYLDIVLIRPGTTSEYIVQLI